VVVSQWNHGSWAAGAAPAGRGTISEVGDEAVFTGRLFLNTAAGRDTFETLKALTEDGGPGSEWSFGYLAEEEGPEEISGRTVNLIRRVTVFECSPTLRGAAGPGKTRTLAAKSARSDDPDELTRLYLKAIKDQLDREVTWELEDIRHRLAMDQLHDQQRAEIFDIRERYFR
jgi:hypothetical protein